MKTIYQLVKFPTVITNNPEKVLTRKFLLINQSDRTSSRQLVSITCVCYLKVHRAYVQKHKANIGWDSQCLKAEYSLATANTYHQIFNIRCTKSQNWNVSCLVLQLCLPNPLKLGVKLRMKMYLEQRWQVMLQLHLSDQQFYCLIKCTLY